MQRQRITQIIRDNPPALHAGGSDYFGLAWPALDWLEDNVRPDMTTVETGCGGSTVVFAAMGSAHTAVSPAIEEQERIKQYCAAHSISADRVSFVAAPSHAVLPEMQRGEVDVALIDGAHGFPYPLLDWFYLAPRLKVGANLLVDDSFFPTVNALVRYLMTSSAWEFSGPLGYRTTRFTKVRDELPGFDAVGARFDAVPRFNYLPPVQRVGATARYLIVDRLAMRARSRLRKT